MVSRYFLKREAEGGQVVPWVVDHFLNRAKERIAILPLLAGEKARILKVLRHWSMHY